MLAILGAIVYTFRDSAKPILEQLKKTTPAIVGIICIMAVIYHLLEGLITTILARKYNPGFSFREGVTNAFFCSFYRVATLGSGAGVAALVYLGEHGVDYSKGFGMYMLQYAFHKISIALYSILLFTVSWTYMCSHFGDYIWLLGIGYFMTLVITGGLILFCCSARCHRFIFFILCFFNKKLKGRFTAQIELLQKQCGMLEDAAKYLLKKQKMVAGIIALDLIKFCFWYSVPYLVIWGQSDVTVLEVMAITSLSVMLAAVIPAPAGIGSTEFVLTLLLGGVVGTGLAGSASLLYRFATFVFPFLVGAVIVIARRIRERRVSFVSQ